MFSLHIEHVEHCFYYISNIVFTTYRIWIHCREKVFSQLCENIFSFFFVLLFDTFYIKFTTQLFQCFLPHDVFSHFFWSSFPHWVRPRQILCWRRPRWFSTSDFCFISLSWYARFFKRHVALVLWVRHHIRIYDWETGYMYRKDFQEGYLWKVTNIMICVILVATFAR